MKEKILKDVQKQKEQMRVLQRIRDNWNVGDRLIMWDFLSETFEEVLVRSVPDADNIIVEFIHGHPIHPTSNMLLVNRYHFVLIPVKIENK